MGRKIDMASFPNTEISSKGDLERKNEKPQCKDREIEKYVLASVSVNLGSTSQP